MLNSRIILSRLSVFNWNFLKNNIKPHQPAKCAYSTIKKYTEFKEENATEIFDVEEERARNNQEKVSQPATETENDHEFVGLNLQRGATSVFEIEDLVDVLHKESAEDVFVCAVPNSLKYVDFLVVCSGRSFRHMISISEFVRRMFKIKRHKTDVIPVIEGKNSREWMAMDLGNIALHIMSPEAREKYDLESLWAIGAEYDHEFNKPKDPLVELFDQHLMLLAEEERLKLKQQTNENK